MLSNLRVYLAIAEDALAESKRLTEEYRRPKQDGTEGFVVTYDPNQKSFQHSLIAIVFAGIYLDALLYIEGVKHLGKDEYDRIGRKHYEEKLTRLGVTDSIALTQCKAFREARNHLVHEKATELLDVTVFHKGQDEAVTALSFVRSVPNLLAASSCRLG